MSTGSLTDDGFKYGAPYSQATLTITPIPHIAQKFVNSLPTVSKSIFVYEKKNKGAYQVIKIAAKEHMKYAATIWLYNQIIRQIKT